jgi:hypothetical protein
VEVVEVQEQKWMLTEQVQVVCTVAVVAVVVG